MTANTASPATTACSSQDAAVHAELTASERVGVHRYTFAEGAQRHVLLDLRSSIYNYPGKVLWSRIRIRGDRTVTGMRETRGWAPGRQLFFAMRFSAPASGHALYNKEEDPPPYHGFKTPGTSPQDTQSIEGRGLEAVFDFAPSSAPLIVKVALSPVSEAKCDRQHGCGSARIRLRCGPCQDAAAVARPTSAG